MAEIKVQKKPAVPPWLWVVLAILLAALAWWIVSSLTADREPEMAATAVAPATEPRAQAATGAGTGTGSGEAAAGPTITELSQITGADDPAALVGREVKLSGAPVGAMMGDATFWLGSGPDRVLVVLDEQIPSPPANVEGRVNVNAGQTVDVQGRVRAAGDAPGDKVLDAAGRRELAGQDVYIWADAAQVATPASAAPAGPPGRR